MAFNGNFVYDGDTTFEFGMDSNADPVSLPVGRFSRGMNILVRGGVAQCRPGYRCRFAMPVGNIQGGAVFSPKQGLDILLFAVDGCIYASESPFVDYRLCAGVTFPAEVRKLYFQQVEQAVEQNPDGSIAFINPRNLMIIQDGGRTTPVVFDGRDLEKNSNIQIGGPMAWIGDRLWVATGAQLRASDINNPLSFIEDQYIATVSAFTLPSEIVALAPTPTVSLPTLLVFTDDSTTMIQASIRDRSSWPTTPDMQKIVFDNIGCKSDRSVIAQRGLLWWYSAFGLTSFDAAQSAQVTNKLPYRDAEMAESKSRLSDDLTGIACASFENFLLCSVPYADIYNRHTWVLDSSVKQSLTEDSPTVWSSFWTGTRPVQWLNVEINGKSRLLYFSPDFDGVNRLWEAFMPDRLDEGCPISWYVESRGYVGDNRLALREKQFQFARVYLTELLGDVDIGIFWAGAYRGRYKQIYDKRFKATGGCFNPSFRINMNTRIFGYKKQSRVVQTEDVMTKPANDEFTSCGVESPWAEQYDDAHQLLIVGSGRGAIRATKLYFGQPSPKDDMTKVDKCADETEANVVRFDGAASEMNNSPEAHEQLTTPPLEYTSAQSASVESGGFIEVGTGTGRSIISQRDADKIALCVATRKACHELEEVLPLVVSLGDAANT